jgi:hypothetical protein
LCFSPLSHPLEHCLELTHPLLKANAEAASFDYLLARSDEEVVVFGMQHDLSISIFAFVNANRIGLSLGIRHRRSPRHVVQTPATGIGGILAGILGNRQARVYEISKHGH